MYFPPGRTAPFHANLSKHRNIRHTCVSLTQRLGFTACQQKDHSKSRAETTGPSVAAGPSPRRRGLAAAGYATVFVVFFVLCYLTARTSTVSSDGANNALQGFDLLHGDPVLGGWIIGDATYYTFELPIYAVTTALFGLGPTAGPRRVGARLPDHRGPGGGAGQGQGDRRAGCAAGRGRARGVVRTALRAVGDGGARPVMLCCSRSPTIWAPASFSSRRSSCWIAACTGASPRCFCC